MENRTRYQVQACRDVMYDRYSSAKMDGTQWDWHDDLGAAFLLSGIFNGDDMDETDVRDALSTSIVWC